MTRTQLTFAFARHVVLFSKGHSSALVATEVVRRYGPDDVVLLNHDIHARVEDADVKRFGLAGYADRHPDAGKVQAKLCGRDGIVERGWCTRTGTGELTLTAKGRRHAASLAPAMGGAL